MNKTCKACGGRCCKVVIVKMGRLSADLLRFFEMRGTVHGANWHVRSRCKHLTIFGRCRIYETRPQTCKDFEVGGKMCNETRRAT